MDYLHRVLNICHRDLKASNIFLEQTRDRLLAKISDFGESLNSIYNYKKNILDVGTRRWMVS